MRLDSQASMIKSNYLSILKVNEKISFLREMKHCHHKRKLLKFIFFSGISFLPYCSFLDENIFLQSYPVLLVSFLSSAYVSLVLDENRSLCSSYVSGLVVRLFCLLSRTLFIHTIFGGHTGFFHQSLVIGSSGLLLADLVLYLTMLNPDFAIVLLRVVPDMFARTSENKNQHSLFQKYRKYVQGSRHLGVDDETDVYVCSDDEKENNLSFFHRQKDHLDGREPGMSSFFEGPFGCKPGSKNVLHKKSAEMPSFFKLSPVKYSQLDDTGAMPDGDHGRLETRETRGYSKRSGEKSHLPFNPRPSILEPMTIGIEDSFASFRIGEEKDDGHSRRNTDKSLAGVSSCRSLLSVSAAKRMLLAFFVLFRLLSSEATEASVLLHRLVFSVSILTDICGFLCKASTLSFGGMALDAIKLYLSFHFVSYDLLEHLECESQSFLFLDVRGILVPLSCGLVFVLEFFNVT